jgi:hypothetical protein
MLRSIRRLTIRNLVSPYGLAMVSYVFFLFAWTFPPDIYTSYVGEPDLMFLDPVTFFFFTSCVAAFLLGVRTSHHLGISAKHGPSTTISVQTRILYLVVPLVLATTFCSIYLILLGAKFDFISLLVSQQAIAGKWSESLMALTSVLWWALFRMGQLNVRGVSRFLFYFFFLIGLGVDLSTCIATVDRTNLMPLIAGLLIIYLYRKSQIANIRLSSLLFISATGIVSVVAAFSVFFFLRGASALKLLAMGLLGYTVAPYNHMAALLHGVLRYSYEGRGVYLSSYLLGGSKLNEALGLSAHFNWPTAFGLWQMEFVSTASAGLNPGFIWSGVFGYLYSDLGWWAPSYLFCTGVLAAYLWARFNAGRSAAIVSYLWVAFWVLFWLGWNLLLDARFLTILESGVVLAIYDRIFIRRVKENQENCQGQEGILGHSRNTAVFLGRDR